MKRLVTLETHLGPILADPDAVTTIGPSAVDTMCGHPTRPVRLVTWAHRSYYIFDTPENMLALTDPADQSRVGLGAEPFDYANVPSFGERA